MMITSLLAVALIALARNSLRSLLTVLGVVIGIAAVIAMVAVGQGARMKVSQVFEAMGTNLLIVTPGSTMMGGLMGGAGSAPTLTWGDLEAIRTELSAVRWAAPMMTARLQVAAEDQNWNTAVGGTTPDFFRIRNWAASRGRVFDDSEEQNGAKVAVLGRTVAAQLFGERDPVGELVRVKNVPFEVIGVLAVKGQAAMGQDQDDVVYVPARTFQGKIEGAIGQYLHGIIQVSAFSPEDTQRAQAQVSGLLRDRHRVASDQEDDFRVRNLTEFAQAQAASTATITTMLAAIAAVSLMVGGIGIMNIMLVSVVERTREIGLRMAVGARPVDILVQFLVEALILAGAGGLLGLAAGWLVASRMAIEFGWVMFFPAEIAALAVTVSCGIGVGFGLYPAIKAARLDPIAALRYEP